MIRSFDGRMVPVTGASSGIGRVVGRHGIRVNCASPGSVETARLRRAGVKANMQAVDIASFFLSLPTRSRPIDGQNVHAFSS